MIISDIAMKEAAIILSRGCMERQGCTECPLRVICHKKNRHKPPVEWEKLLIKKQKVNRKGGDHTKKEEP